MQSRVFSTILLWSVVIGLLLLFGPTAGVFLLMSIACLAQLEFYQLMQKVGRKPLMPVGILLGAIILIFSYYHPLGLTDREVFTFGLIGGAISLLRHRFHPEWLRDVLSPTMTGVVMVPFLLCSYLDLAQEIGHRYSANTAILVLIWLIAVTKFSDVGALLVGTRWGRTPFAPTISPKKTWEGFFGGMVFSIIIGLALLMVCQNIFPPGFTPGKAILLAIILCPLGAAADLFKSVLKRQAGVKDSGRCLPGIGGALDLVDSLLFTAPIGAWFVTTWIL